MVKTVLKIDGMMCSMCEAHINDVVRRVLPEAQKVSSSHKKGECTFISEETPDKNKLEAAIAETGYEMKGMTTEPYQKKLFGIFG